MKAAWIANARQGDLSIVVGDTDAPAREEYGLLVAVEAVGLTFGEPHWVTNGTMALPSGEPRPLPVIIGHEFAGSVVEVGAGSQRFSVGDRVFGLIDFWRNGAAAEIASVLPDEVALVPPGVSSLDAATLPIGALTAWQGLFDHGKLQAGQTVLIHGGSGAVGSFAIQIAREAGAAVIATVRGDESAALCRELGAPLVIDTKTTRFEDVAASVDLVFDTVGRDLLERSWAVVRKGGRLVTVSGEASDAPSSARASALGISASWFIVRPDPDQLGLLGQWVKEGRIKALIDATFPLQEASRVFAEASSRPHAGKTVLTI